MIGAHPFKRLPELGCGLILGTRAGLFGQKDSVPVRLHSRPTSFLSLPLAVTRPHIEIVNSRINGSGDGITCKLGPFVDENNRTAADDGE
jgi:hypothetical protein